MYIFIYIFFFFLYFYTFFYIFLPTIYIYKYIFLYFELGSDPVFFSRAGTGGKISGSSTLEVTIIYLLNKCNEKPSYDSCMIYLLGKMTWLEEQGLTAWLLLRMTATWDPMRDKFKCIDFTRDNLNEIKVLSFK